MIGVTALAADTQEEAEFEAGAGALSMVLLRSGRLQEIPTPEQAAAYPYSPAERELVRAMNATAVIGTAEQVADGLDALVDRFGVKEMLVSTRAHGLAAKLRSMELIAGGYALTGVDGRVAPVNRIEERRCSAAAVTAQLPAVGSSGHPPVPDPTLPEESLCSAIEPPAPCVPPTTARPSPSPGGSPTAAITAG